MAVPVLVCISLTVAVGPPCFFKNRRQMKMILSNALIREPGMQLFPILRQIKYRTGCGRNTCKTRFIIQVVLRSTGYNIFVLLENPDKTVTIIDPASNLLWVNLLYA